MDRLIDKFIRIGGQFLVPEDEMIRILSDIHIFIFDWDGVFNDGSKGSETGSSFSEADAMGTNMLRFNQWRKDRTIPLSFIITGENNLTAIELAKREHFNGVYIRYTHKRKALEHIAETYHVSFDEMAFIFDDILDIDAAGLCKMALCVTRKASPLFREYLVKQSICQYISGHEGGAHAVREISELLIGLSGHYDETINRRIEYGDEYQQYISQRNLIHTVIETFR